MNQVTIFDIIEPQCDWQGMTLKEIASYIGSRTGLTFIPDTRYHGEFHEYIAYYTASLFFTVGLGKYNTLDERNGQPFIAVEHEDKLNHSGSGIPCDSLSEAVNHILKILS